MRGESAALTAHLDVDWDGLPDGQELAPGLDPWNPWGCVDTDGLSTLYEYQHDLNMQDNDTDHEGEEPDYWQWGDTNDMDKTKEFRKKNTTGR